MPNAAKALLRPWVSTPTGGFSYLFILKIKEIIYQVHYEEDEWHVSCFPSSVPGRRHPLHFRLQDSPLVAPDYRARLVRKWGEQSNVVRVRADGVFPRQSVDVLTVLDLTEPCMSRAPATGTGPRKLVDHVAVYAKQDPMEIVGRVVHGALGHREDLYVA